MYARSLLLCSLLVLCLPATVHGQASTLQGTVVDVNEAPLPGATVVVEGTRFGTSTGPTGRFELSGIPAGRHMLAVSMVGYQTTTQDVDLVAGETSHVRIELDSKTYDLDDDVVVTATRTAQASSTAPASISVVSGEELTERPVGDLTDAIRDLPGVSLSASSQGRRGIQLRGMESSYTLILMDGKRINSSEAVFRHNDYDIGLVPVEAIERIEVVRGGMSALYGSEALGGVINIITKPVAPSWQASLDTEVQTPTVGDGGSEYRASLYASGALVPNQLGLTLTGGFSRRAAWHGWADEVLREDGGETVTRPDGSVVNWNDLATLEGRNDHSGRAKLTWTPSTHQTVEVEAGHAYQTRFGEYYIRGWGNADTEVNRTDVVLTHEADLSWVTSELRAYGERVDTGTDGLRQTNAVLEGNATMPLGAHLLTAGAEARWVDLKAPGAFTSGTASVRQQALYAQDELRLTDAFKLLGGARLDNHQNFGLHLTPRFYTVFSATDVVTLKAGIGTAFKAPTLRQLSDESIVRSCRGSCLIVGNTSLEPETSTSYEASINLSPSTWGASITVFQNDVANLIDTPRGSGVEPIGVDPETDLPMFVPRNVDEARIRGVESTFRVRLGRLAHLRANYTWLDARDLEADARLDYRPRHAANAKLDWFVTEKATAFVRGQYTGAQTSGELELDPYAMADIGASYRLRRTLRVNVGVQNVTNTRTDDADENYSFVERGRTVSMGMNIRF